MINDLIDPITPEDFFTTYWTKGVLHLSNDPEKFKNLFSWDKLNNLLENHIAYFSSSQLKLSRQGKYIPLSEYTNKKSTSGLSISKIQHLCKEGGATLIVNSAQKLEVNLKRLSNSVTDDIGERNSINIYSSISSYPGFPAHFDTHEVLVLQIEGKKEWEIYENRPNLYPKSGYHDRFKNIHSSPTQYTLTKGDVLYIPRGVYHKAVAQNEPSLHLTIGIVCRTRMDFLRWAIEDLAEIPEFRKNLPLQVTAQSSDIYEPHKMNELSNLLKQGLKKILSDDQLIIRYNQYCRSRDREKGSFDYPFAK